MNRPNRLLLWPGGAGSVGSAGTITTGLTVNSRIITASSTLLSTDGIVEGNHATVPIVLTGLAASGLPNRMYFIKNKGAAIMTVDMTALGSIDGVSTVILRQYDSMIIWSDATTWSILSSNITAPGSVALTSSASITVDCSLGNLFHLSLAHNATLVFTNFNDGQTILIMITNTGSFTITTPTTKWSGGAQPTQTANKIDEWTWAKHGSTLVGNVTPNMS